MLATWCQHRLGARPVETVFRAGHLSLVVGLRLADGQRVVVKVRPPAPRVHGCVAVQRALAAAGFPCPRPLAGPDALAGALVTAEELVPGGEPLADGAEAAARLAGLLAELVAAAPPVAAVPSLRPAPPWVGWDHDEPRLWPAPDDLDEDLNDHPGPEWLDRAAVRVRARLAGLGLPSVVGHGDWESQNVRWRGGQAVAVHDWDSVVAQPEAAIAGQAAAVWPVAGPPGEAASVEQTDRFLAAYERSRGRPWTGVEREVAWAAGLWVRAFNAKKETAAGDGPQLGRLAGEVAERSRNAGI